MKTILSWAVIAALITFAVACSDGHPNGEHHNGDHHDSAEMGSNHGDGHHMGAQTKVVKFDGLQAAFDLMTAANHKKMAASMNMNWEPKPGMDHHLSITIMDLETKKVVEGLNLKISVTGPDGTTVSGPAEVMSGAGMHHYGTDFKMQGPGTYKLKAEFEHNGKQQTPEAEFKM